MKALTLRNIPLHLQAVIERRARRDGLSLSRAVIKLLEEGAGLRGEGRTLHHDLDHLAGTWTTAEVGSAEGRLAEQRQIDPEDWI